MSTAVSDAIPNVRMIDAARGLAPLVSQYRDELAAGPDLPAPLAEALIDAGLTQLWLPRALGGPQVDPIECFEVIEALASLDGAVGWCALVSSSMSRLFGLLAVEPMRRIIPSSANFAGSGSGASNGSITGRGKAGASTVAGRGQASLDTARLPPCSVSSMRTANRELRRMAARLSVQRLCHPTA